MLHVGCTDLLRVLDRNATGLYGLDRVAFHRGDSAPRTGTGYGRRTIRCLDSRTRHAARSRFATGGIASAGWRGIRPCAATARLPSDGCEEQSQEEKEASPVSEHEEALRQPLHRQGSVLHQQGLRRVQVLRGGWQVPTETAAAMFRRLRTTCLQHRHKGMGVPGMQFKKHLLPWRLPAGCRAVLRDSRLEGLPGWGRRVLRRSGAMHQERQVLLRRWPGGMRSELRRGILLNSCLFGCRRVTRRNRPRWRR
jgi:hypothetical protein